MLLRSLSALALSGAVWIAAMPAALAAASDANGTSRPGSEVRDVRAWLLRIHEAASHNNFQGTFVVSSGGAVSSARIAHFCEGKNQFERSESLDGQARRMFRHNDLVYTVWPASRVALIQQRDLTASFPSLLQAGDDRVADFYDLYPQGVDRVAGHEANVMFVRPKDGYRYGYRLWADQLTGLLLRADVIGRQNDVLETEAFSDVDIGGRSQPESVLQPMRKLAGYRVLRPMLTPTHLDAEGWTLDQPAPGFHQVSCVRRPMDGSDLGMRDGAADQVLQTIYSDGLTYVSVFVEPYDRERHTRESLVALGATQTLTVRRGDWWLTVVGDVPPATLRLFANALERKK